jgi:tetratricopeptide (TPR) repeat protein
MAWLEAERENLVAAIRWAVDAGWHSHAWRLARAMWRFLYGEGYLDDSIMIQQLTLQSAIEVGDHVTAGLMYNYLAGTYHRQGRWDDAFFHVDRAIAIREQLGDKRGQAISINNRGRILMRCGRFREGLDCFLQGLAVNIQAESPAAMIADGYANIGVAYMQVGDYKAAAEYLTRHRNLALPDKASFERGAGYSHLGKLELRLGRFSKALDFLEQGAALRAGDDPPGVAEVMCDIGSAHRGLGNLELAAYHQRQALLTIEESGYLSAESGVRIELGITLHLAGEDEDALVQLRRALDIAERLQIAPQRARALDELANILAATDPGQAQELRSQADAIYHALDLPRPASPVTKEG